MKKRLEAKELLLHRRTLSIPWTEYVRNEEVLGKIRARTIHVPNRKRLEISCPILSKQRLENLTRTRDIQSKRIKEKDKVSNGWCNKDVGSKE